MNESELFALDFNASQVRLGASYLLLGTDNYLADRVIDVLRSTLRKKAAADTLIVYGNELKSGELSEHLDTFSIFSEAKLIVIRNAESMDKKVLEALSAYFESPSEIQSLAIVAEKTDMRLKTWKTISTSSLVLNCDPPRYGAAIKNWLQKSLGQMGKTMLPKAQDEFMNRIELDYYHAANELTKLDILSGTARVITEADVMKSLGTTRTGTLIDLYRALGRRQLKPCLEAIYRMFYADWEPLQIFFQFNKFFTTIWKINLLRQKHISPQEIMSKHLHEVFANHRKDFVEFAPNYSLRSLEKIFYILLETDSQYKLSAAESSVLFTNCLIRILQA